MEELFKDIEAKWGPETSRVIAWAVFCLADEGQHDAWLPEDDADLVEGMVASLMRTQYLSKR